MKRAILIYFLLLIALMFLLWFGTKALGCDVCEMQNRICEQYLKKHPEVKRCDAWRYELACMRITTDESGWPCCPALIGWADDDLCKRWLNKGEKAKYKWQTDCFIRCMKWIPNCISQHSDGCWTMRDKCDNSDEILKAIEDYRSRVTADPEPMFEVR